MIKILSPNGGQAARWPLPYFPRVSELVFQHLRCMALQRPIVWNLLLFHYMEQLPLTHKIRQARLFLVSKSIFLEKYSRPISNMLTWSWRGQLERSLNWKALSWSSRRISRTYQLNHHFNCSVELYVCMPLKMVERGLHQDMLVVGKGIWKDREVGNF